MNGIGKNIRRLRLNKGYSQEYMADCLDISQVAYGKIENEKTKLQFTTLEVIAKILEIEVHELINMDDKFVCNIKNNKIGDNCQVVGQIDTFNNNYGDKDLVILCIQQIEELKSKIKDLEKALNIDK